MNTKLLMISSAIAMGLVGLLLTFMPHELSGYVGLTNDGTMSVFVLQILGALYFSFAMVNWTAKTNLIGGIYSRPIAIGNTTHFVIGALALLKGISPSYEVPMLILTSFYVVFAISFGIVLFRHPVKDKESCS